MPYMQVFQDVVNPPSVLSPPPGWEVANVKSGELFPFYAYEQFEDEIDWITGKVTGRKLTWKRASFFVPTQDFMLNQLQPDNSWLCLQIIKGPLLYIAMDAIDGDKRVLRLQAV